MRAYKLEVLVIDFDDVGDEVASLIENARYPNDCISPSVMHVEARDIGERCGQDRPRGEARALAQAAAQEKHDERTKQNFQV